jgi:hypothetical protein
MTLLEVKYLIPCKEIFEENIEVEWKVCVVAVAPTPYDRKLHVVVELNRKIMLSYY